MILAKYISELEDALYSVPENNVEDLASFLVQFDQRAYVIGNGGSFALAEHFAQDLMKKAGIRAMALSSGSNLTAYGNDEAFDTVYSSQLAHLIEPGDCLIAFSSSGNSINIYNACKVAQSLGAKIISFTGFSGGKIIKISDLSIHVPSNDYGIIETAHSLLFHYLIERITWK